MWDRIGGGFIKDLQKGRISGSGRKRQDGPEAERLFGWGYERRRGAYEGKRRAARNISPIVSRYSGRNSIGSQKKTHKTVD